jgi:hypothetical protein
MSNFVQTTEFEMYMHSKFEYLDIHIFLQLIFQDLGCINFTGGNID